MAREPHMTQNCGRSSCANTPECTVALDAVTLPERDPFGDGYKDCGFRVV